MGTDSEALVEAVRSGDRRALAQAITLIESTRESDREAAVRLLALAAPHAKHDTLRIGISGVPGVGKSTFIEAFGNTVIDRGRRVAVLTVDPSSALSGGSILGDKTRMENLSRRPEAYIRPSPAGTTLGGVTGRTREAIVLCEAAGFDVIIVETVGVGQSETAVAGMTDMFALLVLPSGGDELQGIKRGIMELADLIVVNKADGELKSAADRAAADYSNALRYLRSRTPQWQAPVKTCSALTGVGIEMVWDTVLEYWRKFSASSAQSSRRSDQARAWMWAETSDGLVAALKRHPNVRGRVAQLEAAVTAGTLSPTVAAQELLKAFLGDSESKIT
ncbi:MAG: methylmalonyl Co-A mutase-associated GTPase MeaB [Gammaproteobacteria bacterium]|nr:methylmalonyl Co-A mutase-associated GTPase MeaB [Gammaproteobacteria bacterium]